MKFKYECDEAGARIYRTQPEKDGPIIKKLLFYAKFDLAGEEDQPDKSVVGKFFGSLSLESFEPMPYEPLKIYDLDINKTESLISKLNH